MIDTSSRWTAPGFRPHYFGPLWILWRLGLAPTKRQADFLLVFIIVASSAWTYFIIFGIVGVSPMMAPETTALSLWSIASGQGKGV